MHTADMSAPIAPPVSPIDSALPHDERLTGALAIAATTCHQALTDYRSGLLDEHEVTRAIVRSGVVIAPDEVWLLDTKADRWWRYDGGEPTAVPTSVPTVDSAVDSATGRR